MEFWLQLCRHERIVVWSSGGGLRACRHGDGKMWTSSMLRTWDGRGMKVWKYVALEMHCRHADVETLEVWSSGAPGKWSHVDARGCKCRCSPKRTLWSSRALLLEFLASISQGSLDKLFAICVTCLSSLSPPLSISYCSHVNLTWVSGVNTYFATFHPSNFSTIASHLFLHHVFHITKLTNCHSYEEKRQCHRPTHRLI
jgi:hypothetical protein